jgi:hypothetical protein
MGHFGIERVCVHGLELPELPAVGEFDRIHEIGDVPPLRAGLVGPPETAHRIGQSPAFRNRHGAWFFAIDVLARPRREDRRHGMPAIAGGYQHGIDIAPSQDFVHVAVFDAVVVFVSLIRHLLDGIAPFRPGVADGDELHIGLAEKREQVLASTRTDPDPTQHDAITGRHCAILSQNGAGDELRRRKQRSRLSRSPEKRPP